MKLITTLFLAATALSASAFTIDFTGLEADGVFGSPLDGSFQISDSDPFAVAIPGFGSVVFGASGGAVAVDGTFQAGTAGIEFDSTQVITVEFISPTLDPDNVQLVSLGAATPVFAFNSPTTGTITLASDTASLTEFNFDGTAKIPEPSVSILGALGVIALLCRRR